MDEQSQDSGHAGVREEQQPYGWLESPHGAFRANLLAKIDAPQSVAWSIPLYAALPLAAPAPTERPRFFMDHGVWHDRETGKHLFYEGEGPEAETLSDAWAALVAVGYERDGVRTLGESIAKFAALSGAAPTPQPELTDERISAAIRRVTGCADITAGDLSLKAELRSLRGAAPTQAPQQPCGNHECKAAQRDGVLCADGECRDAQAPQQPVAAGVAVTHNPEEGFMEAFYEVAAMLGIEGAQAKSPEQVYREQVKPALQALKERAENAEAAYLNMREWAQANGLDTTARNARVPSSDGGQQG